MHKELKFKEEYIERKNQPTKFKQYSYQIKSSNRPVSPGYQEMKEIKAPILTGIKNIYPWIKCSLNEIVHFCLKKNAKRVRKEEIMSLKLLINAMLDDLDEKKITDTLEQDQNTYLQNQNSSLIQNNLQSILQQNIIQFFLYSFLNDNIDYSKYRAKGLRPQEGDNIDNLKLTGMRSDTFIDPFNADNGLFVLVEFRNDNHKFYR